MDAPAMRKFSSYTPTELRELYDTDPTGFNELAAAAIRDACIGTTEAQTRKLRQMQWAIEGQLRKQNTPCQKLQEMQKIFYDQLYGSEGLIFKLNSAWTTFAQSFEGTESTGCGKPELKIVKKYQGDEKGTGNL